MGFGSCQPVSHVILVLEAFQGEDGLRLQARKAERYYFDPGFVMVGDVIVGWREGM